MNTIARSARGRRWSPRAGRLAALLALAALACRAEPDPAWVVVGPHRWRPLDASGRLDVAGFKAVSGSRTRVRAANTVAQASALQNRHLTHGSGVALGDVDGDGRIDLFLARLELPNVLYRNLGDWRFEDITQQAGVAGDGILTTGAALADVDGDGDLDLLTSSLGGPTSLYVNDGSGSFTRATGTGLEGGAGGTSLTLADTDADGDLDLYVVNYKVRSALDIFPPEQRTFDRVVQKTEDGYSVAPPLEEHYRVIERPDLGTVVRSQRGEPDAYYLNDGDGTFTRVPFVGGAFLDADGRPLEQEPDWFGLAARFYDVDGDGDPDLYVCNDFEDPDQLWLNQGDGTFRASARRALRSTSNSAMAVDFADIDRDGDVDIFEVDMLSRDRALRARQAPTHTPLPKLPGQLDDRPQHMRNSLFLNRGDGTFAQVAALAGVEATEWSWGTMFLDVDLDGFEDILVSTGHTWDIMDIDTQERLRRLPSRRWRDEFLLFPELKRPNVALRNRGDLTFEDATAEWGFAPDDDISHGIAAADLDGDGDLDVVVSRLNQPPLLLRNEAEAPRVSVSLRGRPPNTRGIGAVVRISGPEVPAQEREVTAGGLYLSSSDASLTFAAGSVDAPLTLEVLWPSGILTRLDSAQANRAYEVYEQGELDEADDDRVEEVWFADASSLLGRRHIETTFDASERQPLVPLDLGRLGPGLAWVDVDGDGDEDLVTPSGRGGALAILRQFEGQFVAENLLPAVVDQTAVLPAYDAEGRTVLLVGQSSYEARTPGEALATPSVLRVSPRASGRASTAVPADTASVGPLTSADIDGDGDLDLFVGGRVIPGAYPLPARSRLFLNEGGRLVLDTLNSDVLARIGLVSGAAFSDVDLDGDPDLILAREWQSLALLENEDGRFRAAGSSWGLTDYPSRWNGVTTGDLDGDGRPDIIATSWGRNTRFRPRPGAPVHLLFGDLDRNGTVDAVRAQADHASTDLYPLESFARLSRAIPVVRRRVLTAGAFAESTVTDLFGAALDRSGSYRAVSYDHTVFMNRGDRFEARSLPAAAQFAPAFHAGVADLDGDGFEDVFITQNFFPTAPGTRRYDAGLSLWLRGDGTGRLTPVEARRSGIRVWGDARGAAFADYDGDGRLDIAVAQNGASLRLFHNERARPGLRVTLEGPRTNPRGVGAVLRLVYPDRRGPSREVRLGSGYASVDALTQVLGGVDGATGVWVRWPDGRVDQVPVTEGSRSIVIRHSAAR